MSDLRRVFDGAVLAAEQRSYIAGRIGRINPDGSISIDVPGKPGFVYVRVGVEGELGVSVARNLGAPKRSHLPVRMRREQGVLTIYNVDGTGGRLEAFLGDGGLAAVNYHTHRTGSGLEFVTQRALLEPYWSGTAIDGTPQVILSSGVDHLATVQYVLWTAAASTGGVTTVENDAHSNIVFGADVFQFAVSAAGALSVARVSGSNAGSAQVWLVWG